MQAEGEAESLVVYTSPDGGRTRVLRGRPEIVGDFVVVHRRGGDIYLASKLVLEIRPPYTPEGVRP
jgi:hypothetical protein